MKKPNPWIILTLSTLVMMSCAIPTANLAAIGKTANTPGPGVATADPLAAASLQLSDLPSGYHVLTQEELTTIGVSPQMISDGLAKVLPDTQVKNLTLFGNTDTNGSNVVVSFLIAPLNLGEGLIADQLLKNPESLLSAVAGAADATVTPLADMPSLGNKTAGVHITAGNMQQDIILARHGSVLEVVAVTTQSGSQAPLSIKDLASLLDGRVAKALGK